MPSASTTCSQLSRCPASSRCEAAPRPPDVIRSGLFTIAVLIGRTGRDEQLDALSEGDAALKANDQSAGSAAFARLAPGHGERQRSLPLIDVANGQGDLARQRDDVDRAIQSYGDAVQLARRYRCTSAEVRAGISLDYRQLGSVSAILPQPVSGGRSSSLQPGGGELTWRTAWSVG